MFLDYDNVPHNGIKAKSGQKKPDPFKEGGTTHFGIGKDNSTLSVLSLHHNATIKTIFEIWRLDPKTSEVHRKKLESLRSNSRTHVVECPSRIIDPNEGQQLIVGQVEEILENHFWSLLG